MAQIYLLQNLAELIEDCLFVKFILIEWKAFDKPLHGFLRLEGQKRQTEGNISPLSRIVCETESLTELLDDVFSLPFLGSVLVKHSA
jgi:hypothetical protein